MSYSSSCHTFAFVTTDTLDAKRQNKTTKRLLLDDVPFSHNIVVIIFILYIVAVALVGQALEMVQGRPMVTVEC